MPLFTPLNLKELPKIMSVWLQPSDLIAHPNALFRLDEICPNAVKIDGARAAGVYLNTFGFVTWGSLKREEWQWSIDNGTTWKKASKFVDEQGNLVKVIRGS